MSSRPRAPRRAVRILGALCGAAWMGCALPTPGLGVPQPEASALAAFRIAFTRPDGVYVARGDGTEARRLISASDLEVAEAPFLASLDPSGRRLLFVSLDGRDPRSGKGRALVLHVVEVQAEGRRGAWRRTRLDRLVGGSPGAAVEPAMVPAAAWSPQGDRIVLGLRREGLDTADALLMADAAGMPDRLLELEGARLLAGSGLSWTVDGTGVLAALVGPASGEAAPVAGVIARVEVPRDRGLAGVEWRAIASGSDPAAAPDGSRVAVVDTSGGSAGDIVLLDMQGRQVDRFERPAGRGLNHLFWSPDGRYLYYHSLASTGPLGIVEIGLLRCLDTRARRVFDLVRLG